MVSAFDLVFHIVDNKTKQFPTKKGVKWVRMINI